MGTTSNHQTIKLAQDHREGKTAPSISEKIVDEQAVKVG